jgi:hypothetical protein
LVLAKYTLIILLFIRAVLPVLSQPAPAADENIPYLVTFGKDAGTSWGDDDFCQIFYCLIPPSQTSPVYIRVYDPDTGGELDEVNGEFNTITTFSVYGGKGCWSDTILQAVDQAGSYKNGYLLSSKSFGVDPKYDKKWYSFGPFNPSEGEYVEKLGGRVFKIIAQGISGDDGNLYRYFLSTNQNENIEVEGGNLFTYKYHFRLSDDQQHISQIYPYIDDRTVSIQISNFDWDNDGIIRIFSIGLVLKKYLYKFPSSPDIPCAMILNTCPPSFSTYSPSEGLKGPKLYHFLSYFGSAPNDFDNNKYPLL